MLRVLIQIALSCGSVLLSWSAFAQEAPWRTDEDRKYLEAVEILEACEWNQSQFGEASFTFFEIELLVTPHGWIHVLQQGMHGDPVIRTFEVQGDPEQQMLKILAHEEVPEDPCSEIPVVRQTIEDPSPKVRKHLEKFRKLEYPFDIDESLRLHVPVPELRVRLSTLNLELTWPGCDSNEVAQWAQELASLLGTRLDLCRFPRVW